MTDDDRRSHWENVYALKGEAEVSWYEEVPETSLALLRDAGLSPDMAVIDVGGGASRLVDALVSSRQAHVTVLDLSKAALESARNRLPGASQVEWVVSDVTKWIPDRRFDLWHDRAAFHFLTAEVDQQAYLAVLTLALRAGGTAIIGTFALDGPEKCSGLPVSRYDAAGLAAVLGTGFRLVKTGLHEHRTPWGTAQRFQFSTFERLPPTAAT